MWLTKFSIGTKENKTEWAEIHGRGSHMPILLALTLPPCITHSCVYSPSPLCLPTRPYSSGPTCTLSQRHCPVLCRHHQPHPTPLLTWLFFLCLLPMDFYFRPVRQVTHLFSWKPFLKTLGSRSLPGLSWHSFTDFSEHFHCLGIHRNNTSKPTETSIHQPRFNLMICWAKTFPTQCHAGFKRWQSVTSSLSQWLIAVAIQRSCTCLIFESHLHSVSTDSRIVLKEDKKYLNNSSFHLWWY